MIMKRCVILLILAALLLSGCAVDAAAPETTAPETQAPTVPATEAPVQAPVQEDTGYTCQETVLPTGDKATGTLIFYINGKSVYAGGPVADLIEAGIHTYDDLEQTVQPWSMSDVIRVRVDLADTKEKDQPLLFFVGINASNEAQPLSQCLIYSMTVNCEKGVEFGSGQESAHFVTGVTTKDELVAAYGAPTQSVSRSTYYEEMAYYEPFSCAYFTFNQGKVRQIFTYYAANVFGTLAEDFDHAYYGGYMGADCWILMEQYLDVESYLPEKESEEEEQTAQATEPLTEEQLLEQRKNTVGIVEKLPETITLDGKTVKFGSQVSELPEPWAEPFQDLEVPIVKNYYLRIGIQNEEEFYFINTEGMAGNLAQYATVKGIITENRNYTNWGTDNSGFYSFEYDGLTENSTIDDIIEKYGMPLEINCTSYARACFAWLHYEDVQGNVLHLRVDPILNQIVELRATKYFENEHAY